jgi:hypothetical protein
VTFADDDALTSQRLFYGRARAKLPVFSEQFICIRQIAEVVLEVGARLDYGPRALLQISLHLLRSRGNETLTEHDSI